MCPFHVNELTFKIPVEVDSLGLIAGDGNSEVPTLRRESSQGIYGSWVHSSGSVREDDCMIGEVVGRELVLVVSVWCGKERDMTRG